VLRSPTEEEAFYARSTNGGETFGNVINLSDNAGGADSPVVAVPRNNVYILWSENTGLNNGEILYAKSTDGGTTFANAINLIHTSGGSSQKIAASGNNVYMVWSDVLAGRSS